MKLFKKAIITLAMTTGAVSLMPVATIAQEITPVVQVPEKCHTTAPDIHWDRVSLDLDDDYEVNDYRNATYVVIEAYADSGIAEVTINGKDITNCFPESGGRYSYRIAEPRTYHVTVTSKNGRSVTKEIEMTMRTHSDYYDREHDDDDVPTLELSKKYKDGSWYLVISASDDHHIDEVTVDNDEITFDRDGGKKDYKVTSSGTYIVKVKDSDGHTTKKQIYIDVTEPGTKPSTPAVIDNTKNTEERTDLKQKVVFKANSTAWYKDGITQAAMDTAPVTVNGRIHLPLRYVAEALGISTANVSWDANSQTATLIDGANTVKVRVGSRAMTVNGSTIYMDTAPVVFNGRILLPISQIAKAFSYKNLYINWDNTYKQVTIGLYE